MHVVNLWELGLHDAVDPIRQRVILEVDANNDSLSVCGELVKALDRFPQSDEQRFQQLVDGSGRRFLNRA
jgi:hypothetical protein